MTLREKICSFALTRFAWWLDSLFLLLWSRQHRPPFTKFTYAPFGWWMRGNAKCAPVLPSEWLLLHATGVLASKGMRFAP